MSVDRLDSPLPQGTPGVDKVGSPPKAPRPASTPGAPASGDVLRGKLDGKPRELTFSGHAIARIERRGIVLDDSSLARLQAAVELAGTKGARNSLAVVDDTAFVVSVTNRTVITAVGSEHMKEQVFTNIDSTVIA